MSKSHASTEHPYEPGLYEIRIKGHLDDQWSDWFGGLTINLEDNGDTLLTGPVVDQAALHGLLKIVRDLGMPLVSICPIQPGHPADAWENPGGSVRRQIVNRIYSRQERIFAFDNMSSAFQPSLNSGDHILTKFKSMKFIHIIQKKEKKNEHKHKDRQNGYENFTHTIMGVLLQ